VEVTSINQLTPRLVSICVGGESMADFPSPQPTSHIKVLLPPDGERSLVLPAPGPDGATPDDAPRPTTRTYTPRRLDPVTKTLEIQFVLHERPGPASAWAAQAKVGDRVAIAGPGGRFQLDPAITRWWIAGDESALPAVATLLDALAPTVEVEVHLEVDGPGYEIALPERPGASVTWHQRRVPEAWGEELYDAATHADLPEDAHVWVACEAAAMRRIRKYLLAERNVPAHSLVSRGYWRFGEVNHPDHDYGDDALD
jgi:NADPH-dependent ferric siderophore reductase